MLTEQIKKELVARITATEKVDKILLFGSQATGNSDPDSDIDLLVVLDDETLPGSFKERSTNFLHVSRAIRDIEKIYPIGYTLSLPNTHQPRNPVLPAWWIWFIG